MYADNVALPASRDQWNYIHQSGRRLRDTFNNVSAVFSPSCISHEVVTMSYWTDVEVSGVSLPDALQCWAASLPAESSHVPSGDYEVADSEDGFTSQKMNALAAPTAGLHRTSASVLSEPPYKLARNLVRAFPNARDQYRNSINRHLSDGGDRHSSRRHPRRRHRNNRTNSVGELNDGFNRKRNRDLVRQIHTRRSTKKHRKNKGKKGKGKKKPKSEEEIQRRKERRRRKRQEKKRRRRERKQRQRQLRRLEQRRLRKERLLQQQEDDDKTESGGHHLKVRSADSTQSPSSSSGKCHFKLIDRCSWPHCNRSCPKLKNPDTGMFQFMFSSLFVVAQKQHLCRSDKRLHHFTLDIFRSGDRFSYAASVLRPQPSRRR